MAEVAIAAQMLNSHVNYTEKIDDYIEGKVDEPGATEHTKCMLGSWIWGAAQEDPELKDDLRLKELAETHREYHAVTANAIDLARAGSKEAARDKITEAYRLFAKISQILMEFDDKINA